MQTALVCDWLTAAGGGERTLAAIAEIYPSPIYTLIHNPNSCLKFDFDKIPLHTSFLQKFPFAKKLYRYYLPFFPLAIEQFDLGEYDVILSVSHSVAKGVLSTHRQRHLCYCFTPMRYAWDLTHHYLASFPKVQRALLRTTLHYLRQWDIHSLTRVDHFAANSHYVAKRIKKIYRQEATVIYPPVDTENIPYQEKKESFFVTVSRLVSYKKIDLLIKAFAHLPDQTLVIIGEGPEKKQLEKLAGPNVCLLGYQPDEIVRKYLSCAKGFLFAAEEDFGIVPVEAQAAGTPVIALGKGGALETVIDRTTGLFFPEQTIGHIVDAIRTFLSLEFDPLALRLHAGQFSKRRFQEAFKHFVEEKTHENPHPCRR